MHLYDATKKDKNTCQTVIFFYSAIWLYIISMFTDQGMKFDASFYLRAHWCNSFETLKKFVSVF